MVARRRSRFLEDLVRRSIEYSSLIGYSFLWAFLRTPRGCQFGSSPFLVIQSNPVGISLLRRENLLMILDSPHPSQPLSERDMRFAGFMDASNGSIHSTINQLNHSINQSITCHSSKSFPLDGTFYRFCFFQTALQVSSQRSFCHN